MKFTDGYWMKREGVEIYGAYDIRDIEVHEKFVRIYAAPFEIQNPGQTLGGPLLTVEFSAPHEYAIAVKAYHFKGKVKGPCFETVDKKLPFSVEDDGKRIIIRSGELMAVINRLPFGVKYYCGEKFLTESTAKQLAYVTDNGKPYFRERLKLSVGEYIYGLGERFTSFVKNGQTVDIRNEDGGTSSEQAYKNIPFCISNRGYGVFVNHPETVSYEIGSEAVSRLQFSVAGEELSYMIIGGERLTDVVSAYTDITGKPSLPPAWSFGLWLSTSFTTEYNEEIATHFIDGMLERNIPLSVFHFDCFWMKEYEWCNFKWDGRKFIDPEGMLTRIKSKGIKICCWINPYIGQKSELFDEGVEKGYFIKNTNGDVWQWDMWQPGMAIVDFTNPGAVKWYEDMLGALIEQGVDCFKTDFGERIPTDVAYFDGSCPMKMHNYYSFLYNKIVFELLEERKGKHEAIVFARSATVGSQKFPVHWGGDCEANYESMAESLRGGLSLGVCGFGFWSHDIGGFEMTATADVYKRWVAFGLFSSHSRLHGSSSYRVPWLFDEEAVDVLRCFAQLKQRLMPYIFSMAVGAAKTGVPVMSPMVLRYEHDSVCGFLDKQYMFGDSLVVAPVFDENGESEIYLPEGVYTHLLTGEIVEGGRFIKRKYDYFGLHVWAAPNSIIAMFKEAQEYDGDSAVEFHVYRLEDAASEIYGKDGRLIAALRGKAGSEGMLCFTLEGEIKNASVVIHGEGNVIEYIDVPAGVKEIIRK